MNRRCICRHCAAPVPAATEQVEHPPVELPDRPRPFRVHNGGRTQDCVLHPDGRMTMRVGDGELVSALSFDAMRERNWEHAVIEWDPDPLPATPEPGPTDEAVQESLLLPTP
ncbi:hypothetical protein [Streptomyces sp. MJP52]|uniref:hypothetical protein n=1 Tax=Streptomyces sp. MJP52 TaxID=2940555 RepID=UPI002476B051|nr:hypothetical protein [Streptomyces sp. MJP52]MDH6224321.1 hypothetical protein [Streptomyces sp. MJP52]